jgi:peptidylprolyl isomerase
MPSSKPTVSIPTSDPPTDLVIDDLEIGAGAEVRAGANVEVHYVGISWSTGTQFDASWDRGTPSGSISAPGR